MLKFSSYSESFDELLENEGLKKKAAKSGISLGTLKKVYNRGMAAWRTGHRPGTTPQQWGMARVNSYITKGKGTYYGADSDLSGKGKKKKDKKEGYVSYAQQKAAHASMAERGKKKKNNEAVTNDLMNSVNEISKKLAKNYISKAARDVFQKGRDDERQDAISKLGGTHPDQDYQKGPERKASMRVRGIDRATNRLSKKEAMSDAEKAAHQKAIDAFKAKGGKIKKLKPGYAQGYHGKSDPAAGMKGMMDKGDTKAFGTRKKVGSMK
tara:strand:+ start:4922 stop:5722 length:801 start_codon:yes stop_codon:yes gene_type:complete